MRRALGLALASLTLVACGTSLQYIDNSGKHYEQRGAPGRIKVLYKEPSEKYDLLGTINWDYYQPGFRRPAITDVLPQLRMEGLGGWRGCDHRSRPGGSLTAEPKSSARD